MGQFSWLDCITGEQIIDNKKRKSYLLVPKEFGGGHIVENCYDGYGHFGGKDVYELVAIWNREYIATNKDFKVGGNKGELSYKECEWFKYYGDLSISIEEAIQKSEEELIPWATELRDIGISIACYDDQNSSLRYPIKITHSPAAIYENCIPSDGDPGQGWEQEDDDTVYFSMRNDY